MVNEQSIRDGLLQLRETLNEKYERIKSEIPDLEQQINAIDLLIAKQFGNPEDNALSSNGKKSGEISEDKSVNNESEPPILIKSLNKDAETAEITLDYNVVDNVNELEDREGSVRYTARKYFHELPNLYTKTDVAKLVESHHSSLIGKKINVNSLSGIVKDLVKRKMAKVKMEASGTSPKVYEKI